MILHEEILDTEKSHFHSPWYIYIINLGKMSNYNMKVE